MLANFLKLVCRVFPFLHCIASYSAPIASWLAPTRCLIDDSYEHSSNIGPVARYKIQSLQCVVRRSVDTLASNKKEKKKWAPHHDPALSRGAVEIFQTLATKFFLLSFLLLFLSCQSGHIL